MCNVSVFWRGFIHTLPWIGPHLAWNVGRGTDILIGIDPVVGSHTGFFLPEDLRTYLQDLNINTLDQAQNTLHDAQNYWVYSGGFESGGHLC